MNKPVHLGVLIASALLTVGTAVQAQTADPRNSGYVISPDASVVKNATGLCWRTGYFTPANAIRGCDDDLLPRAAPAPAAPTSEKVTFAADTFFDFDKSIVKPEGKAKLDDLVGKIKGITLEVVIAVGHTDNVGTDPYNQKLSVRRAEAVKAYLVSKGIEANRVYTEGKGEKQPTADNKTTEGRAKNRRVEIEVVGTRARK